MKNHLDIVKEGLNILPIGPFFVQLVQKVKATCIERRKQFHIFQTATAEPILLIY